MKKNLSLLLLGTSLLFTTLGCLKDDTTELSEQLNQVDPRSALILALDNQASNLVNGLNKVIIEGKLMQNLSLQNPPKPIPLGDDNEVQKAISYLLANQNQQGGSYTYKPNLLVCSEVFAKNDPAACSEIMKLVTLTQTPANDTDGTLEITVGNAQPLTLYYTQNEITVRSMLSEVINTLTEVEPILKQYGSEGFGKLPSTYAGSLELKISSFMSVSQVALSITLPIDVQGENEEGNAYSVQISAGQDIAKVTFDSVTGIAIAAAALPTVQASVPVYNQDNISHQVQFLFPGLSGAVKLDNSVEQLAFQAIQLASSDMFISVDGQTAAHFHSASQINAHLQTFAGGDKSVVFADALSAQIDIFANALIEGNGQLTVNVAQGTELYFKMNSEQAQVAAGSIQLLGTGSFNGALDAQAGSCIEGQEASFPLQAVMCK